MNFRRGLFRLWLIASLLWCGLWTAISWDNLKVLSPFHGKYEISIADRHLVELDGAFVNLPSARQNEIIDEVVAIIGLTERAETVAPITSLTADQQREVEELENAVREEVWDQKGLPATRTYVAGLALPPIGSLVLGILLFWAFAGFAKR